MAVRNIVLYPSDILRLKSEEVREFDADLATLVSDMAETMYDAPGIGLAAPQIGVNKRVAVVDLGADEGTGRIAHLYTLINPVITESQGYIKYEEGCLSIPGLREYVERPSQIQVKALDVHGKEFTLEAEGLLAVCIQHEIDHLNGVLFTDKLEGLKRKLAVKKLKKHFGTSQG